MFQNKPHWLRFLVYGTDNIGFFAVVPIANFRGSGDDEKMNLMSLGACEPATVSEIYTLPKCCDESLGLGAASCPALPSTSP